MFPWHSIMFYNIPFLSNHLPLVVVVPAVHLLISRIAFPLRSLSCYSIFLALTPLGTIYYTCSCLVTNSISLALTPLVCHSCFTLTAWVIPQASSSGCWSRVLCRRPQSSLPGCRLTGRPTSGAASALSGVCAWRSEFVKRMEDSSEQKQRKRDPMLQKDAPVISVFISGIAK